MLRSFVGNCHAIEEAGLHYVRIVETRDISNLVRIHGLTGLEVYTIEERVDLGPVSELVELRSLWVNGNWRGHVSLAALRNLEVFGGEVKKCSGGSISGIPPTSKLRYAEGRFDEKQLLELSHCRDLRTFILILNRLKNLDWLVGASPISCLSFFDAYFLSDMSGLRYIPSLKYLKFQNCKRLGKLDALESLTALEVLLLDDCGDIESLIPLKKLGALRVLSLNGETKVLDGRTSVLDSLPKGASVRFMNRPIYDHPASQFSFDQEYFAQISDKYMELILP
jgi:hypothetical protein